MSRKDNPAFLREFAKGIAQGIIARVGKSLDVRKNTRRRYGNRILKKDKK